MAQPHPDRRAAVQGADGGADAEHGGQVHQQLGQRVTADCGPLQGRYRGALVAETDPSTLTRPPPRLRQAYLSLTPGLVSSHRKILVIRSGCQALLTGFGSLRSDTGGSAERELGVQGGALPGRAEEGDPAA